MARTEARWYTSAWSDPDVRALSRPVQGTYMYLVSQPDLSFCGVLVMREQWWAQAAAGLTLDELRGHLAVLAGTPPFIVMDESTGELLVRSLIRQDKILRQPKLIKPLKAAISAVGSLAIRSVLRSELERAIAEESVNAGLLQDVAEMIKGLEPLADEFPQVNTLSGSLSQEPAIGYAIPTGTGTGTDLTPAPSKPSRGKHAIIPGKAPNAGDVIAAYVDGALGAGQPRPAETLRARVGKQARQLLAEGYDAGTLVAAAATMGAGEWNDLAVQVRKDAAASSGAGPVDRRQRATDQKFDRAMARAIARDAQEGFQLE